MKKLILLAAMIAGCIINAGAQTTKVSDKTNREGDVFIANGSKAKSPNGDQATPYKWRDSKGNEYQIILHEYTKGEKAGRFTCYVWRVSKKTGKEYKYYLPDGENIAAAILKENE